MEIDFTSSSATSSVEAGGCACGGGGGGTGTMDLDDVCDLPVDISHSSSSPLVKSQPMSVPQARKLSDDHHPGHQMPASRGIDPPNGYVPMRPSLKTAGGGGSAASSIGHDVPPTQPQQQQHISMPLASSAGSTGSGSSYMCMKPVGASPTNHHPSNASFPYQHHHHSPKHSNAIAPPTPTTPAAPHIVMAKLNTKRGSIGGNNNSTRSMAPVNNSNSDYLTMSPSQEHLMHPTPVGVPVATATIATTVAAANAPEGYMEMKWIKPTDAAPTNNNVNNNNHFSANANANAPLSPQQTARLSSQPININHPARNSSAASATSASASAAELNNERKHHGNLSLAVKTRVRCDSKDSGIMTPTGSHTSIFPFSPSSPKTAFAVSAGSMQPTASAAAMMSATANRKCMIDATNGTVHLATAESQSASGDCDPLAATARPTCTGIDQPKVQNKDQTPMQVDTLSNDYADMTLGPKQQQHSASSAALAAAVAAAAAAATSASATPATSATRKTSNLQSRPLQLSSARETTNADYTLMKPSYPYPKKKPLLVQINNNLTNATTKTNATAFRPIAADTAAQRQRSPATVAPATSASPAAFATASPASPSYAPYEMLIARPNSVAQEKVSAVKPQNNTPMMRSSSANSDRLRLSPSVGSSAGSCATIVTASSSTTTSSSSSTSTLCGDTATPAGRPTQQQRPASLAAVLAAVQRASSLSDASDMDACSGGSSPAPLSVTSRPPSVSSERELYYASLDLPAAAAAAAAATAAAVASSAAPDNCSPEAPGTPKPQAANSKPAPSTAAAASAPAQPATSSATSSPSSVAAAAPAFSYAQIDFVKSEQVKANATNAAAPVVTTNPTATAAAAATASLKATAIVTSAAVVAASAVPQ